jgi:hypothetical protein
MPRMKITKCLVCGNETLQGTTCAICKAGITQIQQEIIALLKEDKNLRLLKKLNLLKRNRNISLN